VQEEVEDVPVSGIVAHTANLSKDG
jgi:hypothetical protein